MTQTRLDFDAPLVRNTDREYANDAAALIAPKRGKIQQAVIDAFRDNGDMTAHTAERLAAFNEYRSSTIRKRISELLGIGILEYVEGAKEATYRLIEERVHNPLPRPVPERCPTCGHTASQSNRRGSTI